MLLVAVDPVPVMMFPTCEGPWKMNFDVVARSRRGRALLRTVF